MRPRGLVLGTYRLKMTTIVRIRLFALALVLGVPLALAAPAQAGFWEDLLGIKEKPVAAPPPAPIPSAHAPVKQAKGSKDAARGGGASHEQSRVAANLALKAAQKGKDPAMLALQDNTLRRGDIVSGPNGLLVFMGGDPEDPDDARFVPANDPNLEKRLRESLQHLKRPAAADAGKPSAHGSVSPQDAQPVSVERDGKSIRVVGSYQGAVD
jgi:hypothetical protein